MNVTKEMILSGLKEIGIHRGDVLLVHSSLSSFGHVEGGADTVIDALLQAVGPRGTITVPTLSFSHFDPDKPKFDVRKCPSDTGLITEAFRKRPEAHRSLHPVSSVTAIGAKAEYITKYHQDTPCSLQSPYGKIYQLRGASLFLGASFATNSMFHLAEEIVNPSYLIYKEFQGVRLIDSEGNEKTISFRRYDCAQQGITRYLEKMESIFRKNNVIRECWIGSSHCVLLSAKENIDLSVDMLEKNPDYILTKPA